MKRIVAVAFGLLVPFLGLFQRPGFCQEVVLFKNSSQDFLGASKNGSGTGVYFPINGSYKDDTTELCELIHVTKSHLSVESVIAVPKSDVVRISPDSKFVFGISGSKNDKGTVYTIWCSKFDQPLETLDTSQIQFVGLASRLENFVLVPDFKYRLLIFSGLCDESFDAPIWTLDFSPKDLSFSEPKSILAKNRWVGFANYRIQTSCSGVGSGNNSCFWVGPYGVPTVWTKGQQSQSDEPTLVEMGGDLLDFAGLQKMAGEGIDIHGQPKCDVSSDNRFCIVSLAHQSSGQAFLILWDLSKKKCTWLKQFGFERVVEDADYWYGVPVCFVGDRRFVCLKPGAVWVFDIQESVDELTVVERSPTKRSETQPVFCTPLRSVDGQDISLFIFHRPNIGMIKGKGQGNQSELVEIDIE